MRSGQERVWNTLILKGRSAGVPPPQVFCQKSLDLLDHKGIAFLEERKEFATRCRQRSWHVRAARPSESPKLADLRFPQRKRARRSEVGAEERGAPGGALANGGSGLEFGDHDLFLLHAKSEGNWPEGQK
jgi:hypothetical protein